MKKYVFTGKSEDDVLNEALESLKVSEDDIICKFTEQKNGIFKAKKYEVEVVKKMI